MDGSTPNFTCLGTMSADVPPPLWGPSTYGGGVGELKTQKMRGSRSCIGQLPFLCGSVRVRTPPRGSDGVRNKGECQFLKEFSVCFVLRYYKGAQAVGGSSPGGGSTSYHHVTASLVLSKSSFQHAFISTLSQLGKLPTNMPNGNGGSRL